MRTRIAALLVALIMPAACTAETFVLMDGTELEGKVLRTTLDGKVTLRTTKGISVYDVMEFSEDTRTEHFEQFEADVVHYREAATEAALKGRKPGFWARLKVARKPGAKSDFSGTTLACVGTGVVLCVIGGLWMMIAGFAVSPVWGIAFILSGSTAQLAFIFIHWEEAKRPFLTQVVGIALMFGSLLFAV